MNTSTKQGLRVGVEIELGGLDVDTTSGVVQETFGGTTRDISRFERVIETEMGDFRVELDASPLKRWARDQDDKPSQLQELTVDLVEQVAGEIVPCEVVAPPIARSELPRLDALGVALGRAGGRGTFEALRFGFGVHFNPELDDLRPEVIVAHMRAFALMMPWLVSRYHVDPSRRLGAYIDPWPSEYVDLLAPADYAPDLGTLIDDYLTHTPTRNRALDMLPMFAHLDEERVRAALPDEKINPRPTFHYRLSNSRVGDPAWRLTQEWRAWQELEAVAARPDLLERLAQRRDTSAWTELVEGLRWLTD